MATDVPMGQCSECRDDALYLDRVLLEHFALRVCVACKQLATQRDGAFELLSKSRAQSEYALPASSFQGLRCVTKPNPRHASFAPLRLYLRRTVAREAHRLYRDADGLEQEKHRRRQRAFAAAAQRTKQLLARARRTDRDSAQESDCCTATQQQTKKQKRETGASDHRHEFSVERYHEETASWTKHCACGVHVQFEKW